MANTDNLINFRELSEERKKEIQELGRKANKEKWQEKKMLKTLLEYGLTLSNGDTNNAVKITEALINEAKQGNVKAYEVIRDTMGQKPIEVQQIIETPIINDNI